MDFYKNPKICFWTALLIYFNKKLKRPLWKFVFQLRILKVDHIKIFNPKTLLGQGLIINSIYQSSNIGVTGLGGPTHQKLAVFYPKFRVFAEFSTTKTIKFKKYATLLQKLRVQEVIAPISLNSKPKEQLISNYSFNEIDYDDNINVKQTKKIDIWNPLTQKFEEEEICLYNEELSPESLMDILDDLPENYISFCYMSYLVNGSKVKPVLTNKGTWSNFEIKVDNSTLIEINNHFSYLQELRNKISEEKAAEIIQDFYDKKF